MALKVGSRGPLSELGCFVRRELRGATSHEEAPFGTREPLKERLWKGWSAKLFLVLSGAYHLFSFDN